MMKFRIVIIDPLVIIYIGKDFRCETNNPCDRGFKNMIDQYYCRLDNQLFILHDANYSN